MENSRETVNKNGPSENGHKIMKHSPYQPSIKPSLPWLDLRVFSVRVSKCEIHDSTLEYLRLNHTTLNHQTLLEVNGVQSSICSYGVSTFLQRDRLDKKSDEATFVSTDGVRMRGSVKFEIFYKEILMISGVLELSTNNGFIGEMKDYGQAWRMNCESDMMAGTGFLKRKQYMGHELTSPITEVYVAGCFSGTPIILTRTLQFGFQEKQIRKGMLDSIRV